MCNLLAELQMADTVNFAAPPARPDRSGSHISDTVREALKNHSPEVRERVLDAASAKVTAKAHEPHQSELREHKISGDAQ
jgi:hypothetical protein